MALMQHTPKRHMLAFVVYSVVALFIQLMMFGALPSALPMPDLVVLVCFVFRFRFGGMIGFLPIFLALAISDLMMDHLLGLRTAVYALLLEVIRVRHREFKQMTFLGEWVSFVLFLSIGFLVFWIIALSGVHAVRALYLYGIMVLFYPILWYILRLMVFGKKDRHGS